MHFILVSSDSKNITNNERSYDCIGSPIVAQVLAIVLAASNKNPVCKFTLVF